MDTIERYQILASDFAAALQSFELALNENISAYSTIIQDLIKNGRVQKFEICIELAWKTAKLFVEIQLGEIIASPKQVYRQLFVSNLISESLLASLLSAIDDRNQLSHIYKEDSFERISAQFKNHLLHLQQLNQVLQ